MHTEKSEVNNEFRSLHHYMIGHRRVHTTCVVVWTVNNVKGIPLDSNPNQCVA